MHGSKEAKETPTFSLAPSIRHSHRFVGKIYHRRERTIRMVLPSTSPLSSLMPSKLKELSIFYIKEKKSLEPGETSKWGPNL